MKGFKTETATVDTKILDYRKPAPEWGLIRRKQQGDRSTDGGEGHLQGWKSSAGQSLTGGGK